MEVYTELKNQKRKDMRDCATQRQPNVDKPLPSIKLADRKRKEC
jgi:hypothetical protein